MTYPRILALGVAFALAIAAALVWVLISVKASAQQVTEAVQSTEGCPNPQPIETFTGTDSQNTAPFEVRGDTFRLAFEANPIKQEEHASIFIETMDEEAGLTVPFGNLQANPVEPNTRESTNVLEGPGNFSLEIEANNTRYTVTVADCPGTNGDGEIDGEENRPTPPPPPRTQPPSPPPRPQPSPPPRPSPPPSPTPRLEPTPAPPFKAGGPQDGPVPLMPNGSCPEEFPLQQGKACYR